MSGHNVGVGIHQLILAADACERSCKELVVVKPLFACLHGGDLGQNENYSRDSGTLHCVQAGSGHKTVSVEQRRDVCRLPHI